MDVKSGELDVEPDVEVDVDVDVEVGGGLDDELGDGLELVVDTSELVVSFESVRIVGIADIVGLVDIVGIVAVVGNCFGQLELVQVLERELKLELEQKQNLIVRRYLENRSLVFVVAEPESFSSGNALYCHVSAVVFLVRIATTSKENKRKKINQSKLYNFYASIISAAKIVACEANSIIKFIHLFG